MGASFSRSDGKAIAETTRAARKSYPRNQHNTPLRRGFLLLGAGNFHNFLFQTLNGSGNVLLMSRGADERIYRMWKQIMAGTLVACLLPSSGVAQLAEADSGRIDNLVASIADQAAMLEQRKVRQAASRSVPDTAGTGQYPALIGIDAGLPEHVIYRPADLESLGERKLGVLIWGNGGCTDDGASARLHLEEVASNGYVAIAPGRILSGPAMADDAPLPEFMRTTAEDLQLGLDWILAENRREGSPYFGRIDPEAVAVAGHSCGGILSIQMADDHRIKTVIIHNSGLFPNTPQRPMLVTSPLWFERLHTPVLYLIGNETDVGHHVAMADYPRIDHVPVFLAERDVGHEGTFQEPNGGAAAKAAVQWLEWRLRGDETAGRAFAGADCGLCVDPDWKVMRKGF
jgi:hypothetical protein